MTKEDIFLKMRDLLADEFEIEKDAITLKAKFFDDLELDSIDAVDLIVKMKEFIPGKIDPEAFKKVVTIQDIVDVLYPLVHKTADDS